MEVELPTGGCNLYYGTYLDHYSSDLRTRDRSYFNDDRLVLNTSQYNQYGYSLPQGYQCVNTGDIVFSAESQIYFPLVASIILVFVLSVIYKIIIKRLLP